MPYLRMTAPMYLNSVGTRSAIIVVGLLIYSPPARFSHFMDSYVKPIQFRVGEVRLIRWAQEDMGILGDEEEDVMVNAEDFEGVDEHIPLKPSPRPIVNYGSAR